MWERRTVAEAFDIRGELRVADHVGSKFENAADVRVSTLREYLEALGATLELAAVFDDDRRVPIHLGKDAA